MPSNQATDLVARFGVGVVPADEFTAGAAGAMVATTRRTGTSLADRFFLALAIEARLPALTSDRRLIELGIPADLRLIR
jgi:PIN domain nuclease of toxin-antitoxin system